MKPYLLDVNVLLALAWPSHVHHSQATTWFRKARSAGFATCAITQVGFIRISSNPKFSPNAVRPVDASQLLRAVCSLPLHEFWSDELDWASVESLVPAVMGHRQVTDAYLLALAASKGGVFATLDRGVAALAKSQETAVEFL